MFKVKKSDIVFNENDAAYLSLIVEPEGGDVNDDDNVSYVVIYKNEIVDETISTKEESSSTKETKTSKDRNTTPSLEKNKATKTQIKKLTAKKKSIKVIWKKKKGVSGYVLQYSKYKKFKKSKTIYIKSSKSKYLVKKLKAKKKYYFRIRTYVKVGKRKFYSGWSKVKTKKVKK